MRKWFAAAGLDDVEVGNGYNGIEGRGKRPCSLDQSSVFDRAFNPPGFVTTAAHTHA
jgi:hypothetical protein